MTNSRLEKMYEEIRVFSQDFHQNFFDCSLKSACDFINKNTPDAYDIRQNLKSQLNLPQDQKPLLKQINQHHKTIMLTGRTAEGKTTLVNQLQGNLASNIVLHTSDMNLYSIEAEKLNVIDTQGLDNDRKEDNQIVLNSVLENFILEVKDAPSIDAIIVMWCPIKNGRSGLMKTIQNLRVAYGEQVLESCIVMIQGDWRHLVDVLDCETAVHEAVKEIRDEFPEIPILEYDAKRPLVVSQMRQLKEAIDKVEPYKIAYFEKHQKDDFFKMVNAIWFMEKKMDLRKLRENAPCSQENEVCIFESAETVTCTLKSWIRSCLPF